MDRNQPLSQHNRNTHYRCVHAVPSKYCPLQRSSFFFAPKQDPSWAGVPARLGVVPRNAIDKPAAYCARACGERHPRRIERCASNVQTSAASRPGCAIISHHNLTTLLRYRDVIVSNRCRQWTPAALRPAAGPSSAGGPSSARSSLSCAGTREGCTLNPWYHLLRYVTSQVKEHVASYSTQSSSVSSTSEAPFASFRCSSGLSSVASLQRYWSIACSFTAISSASV